MMRWLNALSLLFFYLTEVVQSNLRVAYDVLTPRHRMKPGIIAVKVEGMTDRQLFFMANLITMTPGTLGLKFSEDRATLYIHAMYIDGEAKAVAEALEINYGKRVRGVF